MRNLYKFTLFILLLFTIVIASDAQELTKEEKRNRKKEVRKLLKECVSQYNSEDYALVQTLSDSILSLENDNSDAFYYKSLSSLKSQDTTKAVESLRSGITLSPLASRLKILLSRIFLYQNKPNETIVTIDEVLFIKPNLSEALYLKGLALLALNDSTQALILFKQSLENQIFKD